MSSFLHAFNLNSMKESFTIYTTNRGMRMVKQVPKDLDKESIDRIGKEVADAFFDYEYEDGEVGMKGFIKTRESMYIFMRSVFEAAIRSECAYQSENGEAYLIMTDSEGKKISLIQTVKEMLAESEALGGFSKMLEYSRISSLNGGTIFQEIYKRNARYVSIDILVVLKQYQHQGFMRQMMEFAYERAQQFGIMVALETDDELKAKKYEHLGMILYRVRDCGPGYKVYDMIR